jgi:predicted GNAT family N-acyltransferase
MAQTDIRICDWHEARTLARPVREQVFILEQGVPRELEWDAADATSRHAVAVTPDGQCVGTARLLADGHLGRMAVLPSWRRQGLGSALARALIEEAVRRRHAGIVLHAQTHAIGFYRRLGFREEGEVFDEAGIPHIMMRLEFAADR